MNWPVALLLFAMAVAAGLVLYAPFFLWFRWRSHMARKRGDPVRSIRMTRVGVCFYGLTLAAALACLSSGQLAPESWLGAQMRTVFGALGLVSAVSTAASFIERLLLKRGVALWHQPAEHTAAADPATETSSLV